jgi:PEGA domain
MGWFPTMPGNSDRRKQTKTLASRAWQCGSALVWLAAVCLLNTSAGAAQAVVQYGEAVSSATVSSSAAAKATSAGYWVRPGDEVIAANRRALEERAGKDPAKLMLRSAPNGSWIWVDGKTIGKTPLLLIVAPGAYKVEMEGARMEFGEQQIELVPKETREVLLTLTPRYPTHVELSWSKR